MGNNRPGPPFESARSVGDGPARASLNRWAPFELVWHSTCTAAASSATRPAGSTAPLRRGGLRCLLR
jgi:hypothetical protein